MISALLLMRSFRHCFFKHIINFSLLVHASKQESGGLTVQNITFVFQWVGSAIVCSVLLLPF